MKDPLQQQLLMHQIDAFSATNDSESDVSNKQEVLKIQQRLNPYDWLIKSSDIQLVKKIGTGAFGNVFYGKLRGTTEIAIKVANPLSLSSGKNDPQIIEEFSRELSIWSSLKHPNIVLFIGACIDPANSSIMIVSEFMQNGTLNDAFRNKKIVLDWNTKMRICLQVSSAMTYLHSRSPPLLHRDLKGANILLSREMVAKVGDFGLSKIMSKEGEIATQTIAGTPYWMSPEVIRGERYGTAADVYSFAIILWQILTEKPNPYEEDVFRVQFKVVQGMRPEIPSNIEDIVNYQLNTAEKERRIQNAAIENELKTFNNKGSSSSRKKASKLNSNNSSILSNSITNLDSINSSNPSNSTTISSITIEAADEEDFNIKLIDDTDENEGRNNKRKQLDQRNGIESDEMKEKVIGFIELMKQSWDSDPTQRPSFIEIGRRLDELFFK